MFKANIFWLKYPQFTIYQLWAKALVKFPKLAPYDCGFNYNKIS